MRIDRVEARAKLKPRREPYWHRITQGRYIGFRRLTTGSSGNWLARFFDGKRYQQKPLGDFAQLTDKKRFDAAKKAGEEWFRHLDRGGSLDQATVSQVCGRYVTHLTIEKNERTAADAKGRFRRYVDADELGALDVTKLAHKHLDDWRKRRLTAATKATFNRDAASLRAALNHAHDGGLVGSDHAWRIALKAIKDADGRRELYLDRRQRLALLKAATPEAKRFITALLLLPFRPGDVAKLKVEHFQERLRSLAIPEGKAKARIIPLSSEAVMHFKSCAKDKLPGAWLVSRDDGQPWKAHSWGYCITDAAKTAKLPAATCAYSLRHAVITDLVKGGLDLFSVAKISGTSIVMIEKYYGHLLQEHARKALEKLSITAPPAGRHNTRVHPTAFDIYDVGW